MKQRKLNSINYSHILGITSVSLLSLLTIALLCPVSQQTSYATDSVATHAEVVVNPTIAVGAQSKIGMEVTPDTDGKFTSNEATITVNTNSADGYALYMSTMYGPNLVSSDSGNTTAIVPLAGDVTMDEFTANSWGYSLDSDAQKVYHPVPSEDGEAVHRTSTSASSNELTLTFAAMVDTTLQAGNYSNMVTISAVANPVAVSGLSQLTYMQNMTSDICANTAYDVNGNMNPEEADLMHPVTKQLTDTRDGKKYWVAKLADGNCWMTQNLALDIPAEGLKASDTDITADWNSRSAQPPIATNSVPMTNTSGRASWDLSEVVVSMPEAIQACSNVTSVEGFNTTCKSAGLIDVSGDNWKSTYVAQNGNLSIPEMGINYTGFVAINPKNSEDLSQGGEYDAHYLLGNYYQFFAATAGLSAVTLTESASNPESICPKNWGLPTTGIYDWGKDGSFPYMLQRYGLAVNATTGSISNGQYSVVSAPLYIVRGGYVSSSQGSLYGVGSTGLLLSKTISYGSSGYYNRALRIYGTNSIALADDTIIYNGHSTGMPMRCFVLAEK